MASEISFDQVREMWSAAGGKDTGGIPEWFQPVVTTKWVKDMIAANEVGELRFIGGDAGGRWDRATTGTYRVKDSSPPEEQDTGFRWNPAWHLVTVRDPESRERVILDGNERAFRLYWAVRRGMINPKTRIGIIVGDLHLLVVRIGKATSSLWRVSSKASDA
ncbi:MAG: hypothetical protein ACREKR_05820 [Candidatus Methylomirabilales bacterium]